MALYGFPSEAETAKKIAAELEDLVQGLSPSDIEILRRAFHKIDTDHNDQIDPKELRVFLSLKWKQVLDPETIDSIVRLADADDDGLISFNEFARWQVKYMPLCRGFCMDCKRVILGIDGWYCPTCAAEVSSKVKRSFALCLRCFSKSDAYKLEHEHPYSEFKRFSISGIGKEKVSDLVPTTEMYDRSVLKPLLRRHLMKIQEGNDDETYWNNALTCLMQ